MSNIYDKVLITGAGGMLANAFIAALKSRAGKLQALDHHELDITDGDKIGLILDLYEPTLLLNCAAYTKVDRAQVEPEQAFRVNDIQVLTSRCVGYPLKFIHFSTDFVFDGSSTRPYLPTDATNPLSVYGKSKLCGEEMVQEHNDDHLILRTAWLYGPNGPNFVQTMLKAARNGKPLSVVDDQAGTPTFTDDLAAATLDLIDAKARGTFHITNSGQTTWYGFAKAIFEEFGVTADLSSTTSEEWMRQHLDSAIRPAYSVLDCTETERVIGRKLPDWRDALHRYRLALGA